MVQKRDIDWKTQGKITTIDESLGKSEIASKLIYWYENLPKIYHFLLWERNRNIFHVRGLKKVPNYKLSSEIQISKGPECVEIVPKMNLVEKKARETFSVRIKPLGWTLVPHWLTTKPYVSAILYLFKLNAFDSRSFNRYEIL